MTVKWHCGDSTTVLQNMEDNTIDAVVTDPPYGIAFMDNAWDYDVPTIDLWREVLRVLKPGGHLLSFAGARTQHRMAVNIEDAGFEIRDMLVWVQSQGFPKGLSVGAAVDKLQDNERSVVEIRTDGVGSDSGSGRYNLNNGKSKMKKTYSKTKGDSEWEGWGTNLKPAIEPITLARKPISEKTIAENVVKWGTGAINIDGCRVPGEPTPVNRLERWSGFGQEKRPDYTQETNTKGRYPANFIHDGIDEPFAKYFYCAKASKAERGEGNMHPTVKPLELMKYLVKLITPRGGTVLDPFAGSGTTLMAAQDQGFSCVGIEIDEHYYQIAIERFTDSQQIET